MGSWITLNWWHFSGLFVYSGSNWWLIFWSVLVFLVPRYYQMFILTYCIYVFLFLFIIFLKYRYHTLSLYFVLWSLIFLSVWQRIFGIIGRFLLKRGCTFPRFPETFMPNTLRGGYDVSIFILLLNNQYSLDSFQF